MFQIGSEIMDWIQYCHGVSVLGFAGLNVCAFLAGLGLSVVGSVWFQGGWPRSDPEVPRNHQQVIIYADTTRAHKDVFPIK